MACATMFARILLLTSILSASLFQRLFPPLLMMGAVAYGFAYLLWKNAGAVQESDEIRLENPFQLGMALKFGIFLVCILLLSKFLQTYFGDRGAYILAAASGIADVDPIMLSMVQLSKEGLPLKVAANSILIAVTVNSGVKGIIAFVIGDRALGVRVGAVLVLAITAGLTLC